ncbi:MAG TPA: sugar phosphate nucleotidyltransferase [Gemmatimonadaceae bacterium]|nr:sugar phosphate nucleotidyltransferase [Gemmatimonadaceae bacterium]
MVLAGGVGSRFWPLSTSDRPKQLLPLVTEKPLLEDAVERLQPIVDPAHTFILTNAALTAPIAAVVPTVPADNIIAEPRPAGTAAALTWAALTIQHRDGPDATMICVHADWAIRDAEKFRETLLAAEDAAQKNHTLVTVGVVPTRPDPGFGYIQPSDPETEGASAVRQFVEKPDRARAQELCNEGFLWNSGIFVWRVGDFLSEVRAHTPELREALAVAGDGDARHFFGSVKTPIAVDVGVLERSKKVMVVPGSFGWDDIGTWSALKRVRDPDEFGNVTSGDVHMLDCLDNVVHAESGTVVMYGVENLIVVTQDDITLVTTADRAADLKRLLDSLPPGVKPKS